MTRILITGVTGFVGACLARRLVGLGYEVHSFTRNESDHWRIADIMHHLMDHKVDLRDAENVEMLVNNIRPTIIYHLATHGGFAFQKDTSAIIESNFIGTMNLLRACEKVGFDYFVNTGSSSEYGIKLEPMKEDHFLEPIGDYGVSKAAATLFCRSEATRNNLPIVTLRLFSPYGPWDDSKRFIPYVIKSLLKAESPKLSASTSVRDFVYIDDVVDSYLKVIQDSSLSGEVFNIGSGTQYSIGTVVSMISEIIGTDIRVEWDSKESQRPEPNVWVADINKAKNKLNWQPPTSIQMGLEKTIEWIAGNTIFYP